jgi:ribosome-associated protein
LAPKTPRKASSAAKSAAKKPGKSPAPSKAKPKAGTKAPPAKKAPKAPVAKGRTGKPSPSAARKPGIKGKAIRKVSADTQETLRDAVMKALDKMKAESIVCVDVRGQSSLTDFFIIASGRSSRQVKALAETARKAMMDQGFKNVRMEGAAQADWVVVDCGDVIVHLFRPEVRLFYRLEEVWGLEPPLQETLKNL